MTVLCACMYILVRCIEVEEIIRLSKWILRWQPIDICGHIYQDIYITHIQVCHNVFQVSWYKTNERFDFSDGCKNTDRYFKLYLYTVLFNMFKEIKLEKIYPLNPRCQMPV